MKKQKNGISLIVLVITIIVIIILAVAVILSIANNNPIENANKAKFQNDLKTIQEELTLKQATNYVDEHTGNGTSEEIIIVNLPSADSYMKSNKLVVKDEKLCYVKGGVTEKEEEWAKEVGLESAGTLLKNGENGISITDDGTLTGHYTYQGDEEGLLVVPYEVTSIGETVFSGLGWSITNILLPPKLSSIGRAVCAGTFIRKLVIPASVENVADGALNASTMLQDLVILGTPRFNSVDVSNWGVGDYVKIKGKGYITE